MTAFAWKIHGTGSTHPTPRECGECWSPFIAAPGTLAYAPAVDDPSEPGAPLCDRCAEALDAPRYQRMEAVRATRPGESLTVAQARLDAERPRPRRRWRWPWRRDR